MPQATKQDGGEFYPVTWFAVLERARANRDYERAAEALKELRRLGIDVRYRPQPEAASGKEGY